MPEEYPITDSEGFPSPDEIERTRALRHTNWLKQVLRQIESDILTDQPEDLIGGRHFVTLPQYNLSKQDIDDLAAIITKSGWTAEWGTVERTSQRDANTKVLRAGFLIKPKS